MTNIYNVKMLVNKKSKQNTINNAFKFVDIDEKQKIIKIHKTQRCSK